MKFQLHRLYSLFTYAFFFLFAMPAFAQTPQYFSSGTGSNNSFPFNTTSSNKVQWIYIPSEFPGALSGMITKVYFKSATTGTNKSYTDLTIKMGYTAATNTVTGPFQTTGLTTVFYEAAITIPVVTNGSWVEFPLQTPFFYDNSQNLLVEASTTGFSGGFSIVQNSANGNKRLYGNVTSPTGTANTGLANFGFDLLAYEDNAGMGIVTAPGTSICTGLHEVKAEVKNMGSNTINSVIINWDVNGVPQTPVLYNTAIPIGQTAEVSLGNYNFPIVKTQKIRIWTTDPNGMVDPETSSDTTYADRSALDKPSGYVVVGGSDHICPGDSVLLYALNGPAPLTYQWQFNANDIPGATQSTLYAKAAGFYSVSFDNGACDAQSNFKEIYIAPPVIDLGADSHLCQLQHPYKLDPQLPNAVSYTWSTGDVTPTLDVLKSGTYWVEIEKVPGCIISDTITLTFDPLPEVSGISYLKQGNTYQFTPGGLQNDVSYLWLFGDGNVSTDKNPTHVYSVEQTRTVMFVVFNACGTDTSTVQLIATGISDVEKNQGIALYPNPAQNILHLDVVAPAAAIPVSIINSLGQVVYRKVLPQQENHNIDISSLPAGSYILKVNDNDRSENKRFEILR